MNPEQIKADNYDANAREAAPAYDADIYYTMFTRGDYLVCGTCGWQRPYANDIVRAQDRAAHSTPVRNPSSLDVNCQYAQWSRAMATFAILT